MNGLESPRVQFLWLKHRVESILKRERRDLLGDFFLLNREEEGFGEEMAGEGGPFSPY